MQVKRKHARTLEAIYARPVSGSVMWRDVEAMLRAVGASVSERAGSRVAIVLNGHVEIQHRPHPSPPTMDKGAVASLRVFLQRCGVRP